MCQNAKLQAQNEFYHVFIRLYLLIAVRFSRHSELKSSSWHIIFYEIPFIENMW